MVVMATIVVVMVLVVMVMVVVVAVVMLLLRNPDDSPEMGHKSTILATSPREKLLALLI